MKDGLASTLWMSSSLQVVKAMISQKVVIPLVLPFDTTVLHLGAASHLRLNLKEIKYPVSDVEREQKHVDFSVEQQILTDKILYVFYLYLLLSFTASKSRQVCDA